VIFLFTIDWNSFLLVNLKKYWENQFSWDFS